VISSAAAGRFRNAIAAPAATTNPTIGAISFQNWLQNRVPGVPLFTQDLDCHCFDPNTTLVLNPAAWANPAPGQFGSATLYGDYRQQRRPMEDLTFGRTFRIRERIGLMVRAEFTNVFNRTQINNPTSAIRGAAQKRVVANDPNSRTTAGFGSSTTRRWWLRRGKGKWSPDSLLTEAYSVSASRPAMALSAC
jgi:hypothetical protein